MAVKKSSGETKIQDVSASKKAGGKKSAAKKETAPQKSTSTSTTTAAKSKSSSASSSSSAAPKKAAPKKAAAPIKLTTTQADLLKKISGSTEPGYKSEKKAEQRTIEALQERKLVKRGSKDKASGMYHYSLSNAGKKHLDSTNMPAEKKAD
jgi:hypothetical protein